MQNNDKKVLSMPHILRVSVPPGDVMFVQQWLTSSRLTTSKVSVMSWCAHSASESEDSLGCTWRVAGRWCRRPHMAKKKRPPLLWWRVLVERGAERRAAGSRQGGRVRQGAAGCGRARQGAALDVGP